MKTCDQELCPNWDGFGCLCTILDICMYCKGSEFIFAPEGDYVECGYCEEGTR